MCSVTGLVAGLCKILICMCRDKPDPPFIIPASSIKLELIDTVTEFQPKVLWTPGHFVLRLNLEKDVDKFQYWADKFEMLPMYFMCFYGAQNINTVIEVSFTSAFFFISRLLFTKPLEMTCLNFKRKNWIDDKPLQYFAPRFGARRSLSSL